MQNKLTNHYLLLKNGKLICTDCPEELTTKKTEGQWQYRNVQENTEDSENIEDVENTYEFDKARTNRREPAQDEANNINDSSQIVIDTILN